MGKKRPNGNGTYYKQTGRALWYFEGSIAGKRVKCSGKTQGEARGRWDAAEAAAAAVPLSTCRDKGLTLKVWLEQWFGIAQSNIRYSTRVGYRTIIDRHVVPHLGDVLIAELRPPDVESLQTLLLETLSASSVRQVRTVLRQSLDLACRHELIVSNPVLSIKGPRKAEPDSAFLTVAQSRAVIVASADLRDRARWLLALCVGIRQGEALGLRWDDLELDVPTPTLTIARTLQYQSGIGLVSVPTKTRKSRRTLDLSQPIVDALRSWRAFQNHLRLASPNAFNSDGYVFTTPEGTPMDPSNDRKNWHRTLDRAGVPRIKLHAARHTAASLMLSQGCGLEVVKDVLGHDSIRTTADVYGHLTRDVGGQAIAKLSRALTA